MRPEQLNSPVQLCRRAPLTAQESRKVEGRPAYFLVPESPLDESRRRFHVLRLTTSNNQWPEVLEHERQLGYGPVDAYDGLHPQSAMDIVSDLLVADARCSVEIAVRGA